MGDGVKTVDIKLSAVPKRFNVSNPSMLCARDIIAYVRGTLEKDPWVSVILRTKDKPFSLTELEECRIYWEGTNDNKARELQSLSVDSYFVVNVSELDAEKEDCGLTALEDNFQKTYNLRSFKIMVTGDDTPEAGNIFFKLRDYIVEQERTDVVFPRFVIIQTKLLPNGLNISPFADLLDGKRQRNELTASVLDGVLEELAGKITPNVTVIQDLEENRTVDISLLTSYLILKYNLTPVYVPSFIAEYLQYQFFYPMKRLSLYERIAFLHQMPKVIGYLGVNYGFNCLASVTKKIYPLPHYVLNLSTMQLEEDTVQFSLDPADNPTMRFADFRQSFSESLNPFVKPVSGGLVVASATDDDADGALVKLFTQFAELVSAEHIYPSVKNCVYVMRDGVKYLLYCPTECGLKVTFMSEYFGALEHVLMEHEFFRIIDAQIEMAFLQKARAVSVAEGNKALALRWQARDERLALKPAIPLEVSLYMHLLPVYRNGLSYYDRMLRCCENILPIITSTDFGVRDVNPMFDELSLEALRADPQARKVINCFGTLSKSVKQNPTLPITYQAFKDGGLL